MEVRLATNDDLDIVASLLSVLRMKPVSNNDIRTLFENILTSTYADIMLMYEDDHVVGMAILNCALKLNRIECRIDDVVVLEAARGKGAGTALFEACTAWAWQKKCYKIEFTSRAERVSAQSFYKKVGFNIRDSNIFVKFSPHEDYVKTNYSERAR